MIYSFHHEAEAEFKDAVEFYDEREAGLGDNFEREVLATIERILLHPNSWPRITLRTHRCLCNKFPYSIVYGKAGDEIVIYAVMHQSREPGYWTDRL